MAMRRLRPALQQSEGRSKAWGGAQLVNAFAEKADGDRDSDFAIMAIPGLVALTTIGAGPIRGIHEMDGLAYVVSGNRLYSLTQGMAATDIGTIYGDGPVRMADNGAQLAICTKSVGYVLSDGVLHTPEALSNVCDVTYVDGYFVWSFPDFGQCVYSAINDGTTYNGLDVFAAEGSPDGLVGLVTDHREVHLFGQHTIEIFYNSGGADNAFERQGNAFIERGCFDRDSIAKIDNSIQFMGEDRIIYRLDGYSPARISTHAIEYRIRAATYARALTYTQEGHKFYVLNTDAGSFGYDLATGTWHERKSFGRTEYRCGDMTVAWGRTLLSDNRTGKLYEPSLDVQTEDGDAIIVEIGLPSLEASRNRVTMYAFEVDCETGVGLNSGQGAGPQIMMRYSDDGGRTYSNELWRSMGRIGEYRTRAVWRSLGQFRRRDIRLTISDPVPRLVMSYYADVR